MIKTNKKKKRKKKKKIEKKKKKNCEEKTLLPNLCNVRRNKQFMLQQNDTTLLNKGTKFHDLRQTFSACRVNMSKNYTYTLLRLYRPLFLMTGCK